MINQNDFYNTYTEDDLKLKYPFVFIINGPSSSGHSSR